MCSNRFLANLTITILFLCILVRISGFFCFIKFVTVLLLHDNILFYCRCCTHLEYIHTHTRIYNCPYSNQYITIVNDDSFLPKNETCSFTKRLCHIDKQQTNYAYEIIVKLLCCCMDQNIHTYN